MKGTVVAVFAAILAVAAATEMPKEEVFGECPPVDGEKPVYLMDKWYRGVFYECDSGRPMRQTCPEGLVFDPRKNVCNFPCIDCEPYGPVGDCSVLRPSPENHMRDGVNIAIYYMCWEINNPWKYNCAEGRFFDTTTKRCEFLPED